MAKAPNVLKTAQAITFGMHQIGDFIEWDENNTALSPAQHRANARVITRWADRIDSEQASWVDNHTAGIHDAYKILSKKLDDLYAEVVKLDRDVKAGRETGSGGLKRLSGVQRECHAAHEMMKALRGSVRRWEVAVAADSTARPAEMQRRFPVAAPIITITQAYLDGEEPGPFGVMVGQR